MKERLIKEALVILLRDANKHYKASLEKTYTKRLHQIFYDGVTVDTLVLRARL